MNFNFPITSAMNTNLVEIFLHPPATEQSSTLLQFGLKLLDWPFLIAVVLIIFAKPLKDLINRATMIDWGEKRIHLSKLDEKVGQEIDTEVDAKLEPLRQELEFLKRSLSGSSPKKPPGVQFANDELTNVNEPKIDAMNRIKEALMSPEFRWRTISRLAAIAGISESETTTLLRYLEVDFDVNRSGQRIAKLKSR